MSDIREWSPEEREDYREFREILLKIAQPNEEVYQLAQEVEIRPFQEKLFDALSLERPVKDCLVVVADCSNGSRVLLLNRSSGLGDRRDQALARVLMALLDIPDDESELSAEVLEGLVVFWELIIAANRLELCDFSIVIGCLVLRIDAVLKDLGVTWDSILQEELSSYPLEFFLGAAEFITKRFVDTSLSIEEVPRANEFINAAVAIFTATYPPKGFAFRDLVAFYSLSDRFKYFGDLLRELASPQGLVYGPIGLEHRQVWNQYSSACSAPDELDLFQLSGAVPSNASFN